MHLSATNQSVDDWLRIGYGRMISAKDDEWRVHGGCLQLSPAGAWSVLGALSMLAVVLVAVNMLL